MAITTPHRPRRCRIAAIGVVTVALWMLCAEPTIAAPPAAAPGVAGPPMRQGPVRQAAHTAPAGTSSTAAEHASPGDKLPSGTQAARKLPLGDSANDGLQRAAGSAGGKGVFTALTSLAIVLGLFAGVVWVLRRGGPIVAATLPRDVVEVLGNVTLGHRQQAQLLRLGSKLLLVSVTPNGAETLSEITDPSEADRLAALCRRGASAGPNVSFRGVLEQFRQQASALGPAETRTAAAAKAQAGQETNRA